MKRIAPMLVVCGLVLAGCGGGGARTPSDTSAAPTPSASTTPFDQSTEIEGDPESPVPGGEGDTTGPETPASAPGGYQFIDGMTISVVSVVIDKSKGPSSDAGKWTVIVTEHVENNGANTIKLSDAYSNYREALTYGANIYDATQYQTLDGKNASDVLPAQLVPGSSVEPDPVATFEIPTDQATNLRLTINPDTSQYLDVTFTDLEQLSQ